MSYQLLKDEEVFSRRNLISTPFPLINSVLSGSQDGLVFSNGNVFFITHKSGFSYLKLMEGFCNYDDLLDYLINTNEIPRYFHVYDAPQKMIDLCEERQSEINVKTRKRIQLKAKTKGLTNPEIVVSAGFRLSKITKENISAVGVFDLNLDNKFWNSDEDFLQHGFGYLVTTSSGEPASVCYSACVAKGVAEIDVATLPSFQRRGLAKIVVSAFVKNCIDNNITANWDCFESNHGSLKTAESIGFQPVKEYDFLSIYKVGSI